tara:strand:+ start:393 stop:518 length:126 start_codon:yes stop_codon:yes gene_type:complete
MSPRIVEIRIIRFLFDNAGMATTKGAVRKTKTKCVDAWTMT